MIAASFRDPSGFVFQKDGDIYRQVNQQGRDNYDLLMESGLYQHLVDQGFLIPHLEVSLDIAQTETAYRVIQPERIPFISYPYEWCFSQLKDAALTTLDIQHEALRFGMTLKDASAYNIQFRDGKPLLVDTLSFERYREGQPWVPYRQFCQHFLAPLALMHYMDVRLSQLFRVYMDGLPLDLAAKLLPRRAFLRLSLLLHIFFHARGQQSFADGDSQKRQQLSKQALTNILNNLKSGIESLTWQPTGTDWNWADYYTGDSYTSTGFEDKKQIVARLIQTIHPATIWDLGANTGEFSRIASQEGILTVSCDIDPGAVEKNFRHMRQHQERNLHPLLLDLTNPSPAIGWANQERDAFISRGKPDMILALALIHHLAIANNVPLQQVAQMFARLSRWLIIEFVPKHDKKVQQLLVAREDIFADYHQSGFEAAFSMYFTFTDTQPIADSERIIYLMQAKDDA